MQGYRDLVAWQKAMVLVTEIYVATKNFSQGLWADQPVAQGVCLDSEQSCRGLRSKFSQRTAPLHGTSSRIAVGG